MIQAEVLVLKGQEEERDTDVPYLPPELLPPRRAWAGQTSQGSWEPAGLQARTLEGPCTQSRLEL